MTIEESLSLRIELDAHWTEIPVLLVDGQKAASTDCRRRASQDSGSSPLKLRSYFADDEVTAPVLLPAGPLCSVQNGCSLPRLTIVRRFA
jgi:hypothetical protein